MNKAKIFGYSLFIFLISFAIYLGGNSLAFVDVSTLIIVIGGSFAISVACGGVFTRTSTLKERQFRWQTVTLSVVIMTLIGVSIGIVMLLSNLTSPDSVGPAMAISILTCFTGLIILIMVVIPNLDKCTKELGNYCEISIARIVLIGFPVMCVFFTYLTLTIFIASLGYLKQ